MESRKSHIHRCLGGIWLTLENISFLNSLPMFDDTHATGIILDERDNENWSFWTRLTQIQDIKQRHLCLMHKILWDKKGKDNNYRLKGMLPNDHGLLSNGPEDGLNIFVLPLPICYRRGRRWLSCPFILAHYLLKLTKVWKTTSDPWDVITFYADKAFLQTFLLEKI